MRPMMQTIKFEIKPLTTGCESSPGIFLCDRNPEPEYRVTLATVLRFRHNAGERAFPLVSLIKRMEGAQFSPSLDSWGIVLSDGAIAETASIPAFAALVEKAMTAIGVVLAEQWDALVDDYNVIVLYYDPKEFPFQEEHLTLLDSRFQEAAAPTLQKVADLQERSKSHLEANPAINPGETGSEQHKDWSQGFSMGAVRDFTPLEMHEWPIAMVEGVMAGVAWRQKVPASGAT